MSTGGMAPSGRTTWGYPPHRPFHLLAGYFAVGFLQLTLTVVRQPLPDTNTRLNLVLAAVAVIQVGVTLVASTRLATRLLPYLVASGIVVAAISAWGAAGGQGQLVAGFYIGILGLFSAYFLSRTQVHVLLAIAAVLFVAALLLNYHLDSLGYLLAVIVVLVVMTLVVSSLVEHLRAEAVHDPLTGALNRRGLIDAAEAIHALDGRRHLETTVVEIDLDGFKQYNDSHGHRAGDQLLADVVRDWSAVLRRTDLLSRTGGDEFVLVLPGTSAMEAERLIERMRSANPVQWAVGTSAWTPDQELHVAIDRADEAMYREKASRRTSRPN